MSETVTVEIPDSSYQQLSELAKRSSGSVEKLAARLLSAAINDLADDPLLKLAGILRTGIPDLAARHDDYLTEQLESELNVQEP
jgi:hypothetical protein